MNKKLVKLNTIAKKIRKKVFETIAYAGKGHIGGAMSCIDILVALYFGNNLKINPKKPKLDNRDRFIFSKGHASIALYVVLSELGFFSKKELNKFNKPGGKIAEHPDTRLPGIEIVSGSLGHGLGIGSGIAFAKKIDKKNNINVFVLLGDGECYEGSIWEAAMFANHHHLDNLIAIVDRNRLTVLDFTENIIKLNPFKKKWASFGWNVIEVDGHNIQKISDKIKYAKQLKNKRPTVIIANTIKGKGISYMENKIKWHHGVPSKDLLKNLNEELEI